MLHFDHIVTSKNFKGEVRHLKTEGRGVKRNAKNALKLITFFTIFIISYVKTLIGVNYLQKV